MPKDTYHHGDLHRALIEAGIELVCKEGLEGFSLRKTAALCGVSHGAPYSHFKSGGELIRAMAAHVLEEFGQALQDAAGKPPHTLPGLVEMGRAYIRFFSLRPQYFTFLFYHSGVSVDLDDEQGVSYKPFAVFRDVAYRVFADLGLPRQEYKKNLIALWSAVHGVASMLTNPAIHFTGDWTETLFESVLLQGWIHYDAKNAALHSGPADGKE